MIINLREKNGSIERIGPYKIKYGYNLFTAIQDSLLKVKILQDVKGTQISFDTRKVLDILDRFGEISILQSTMDKTPYYAEKVFLSLFITEGIRRGVINPNTHFVEGYTLVDMQNNVMYSNLFLLSFFYNFNQPKLFCGHYCVFRNIRTANPETSGHETGSIRTLCRLN